jgi:ribonuclease I
MYRILSSGGPLLTASLTPRRGHKPPEFDYYLLSLSWTPNDSASHRFDRSSECALKNAPAILCFCGPPNSCRFQQAAAN